MDPVLPSWPARQAPNGIKPFCSIADQGIEQKSRRRDLNPQRAPLQGAALPLELQRETKTDRRESNPQTTSFAGKRSILLSYDPEQSSKPDLNRQPAVYGTAALPLSHWSKEPARRLELPSCSLQDCCSALKLRWQTIPVALRRTQT